MKKVKTTTKNSLSIGSRVVTRQQIALSLLLVSSFVLGLNFMMMALSQPAIRERIIDPIVPGPEPLFMHDIQSAAINVTVPLAEPYNLSGAHADFKSNDDDYMILGGLDLFEGRYYDGDIISSSTIPLAVSLTSQVNILVPSRVINVEDGDTGQKYNLCLPETNLEGWDNNPQVAPITYYYDTNGTPYHDSLLTRMATQATCNRLLANRLDMRDIQSAAINIPMFTPENYFSGPDIEFNTNFGDFIGQGRLNLFDGHYSDGSEWGYRPGAPLALSLFASEGDIVVPSKIVNVEDGDTGQKYNLCLPETFLEGWQNNQYVAPVTYYYDTNGTPYYDSLLTRMATQAPCNTLLANRLDMRDIQSAAINISVPTPDNYFHGPDIEFNTNFGDFIGQGRLSLFDGHYSDGSEWGYRPGAPLTTSLFASEGDITIPSRIINVEDGDTGQKYNLCLPETSLEGWENNQFALPVVYYYDSNGTPYYDSLLTRMVTQVPCNVLLANRLDIGDIQTASINIPVPMSDGPYFNEPTADFNVNFGDFIGLGSLTLASNQYFDGSDWGYRPGAPLAVSLLSAEDTDIPARIINLEEGNTGHQYSLCLPETFLEGWDSNPYVAPVTYFYDTNGTPYYDSLLRNRANTQNCWIASPVITSPLSQTVNSGDNFNYAITASNNPTSFNATSLPYGLSVDTSTGVISGTVSTIGTYSIEISAINSGGMDIKTLNLIVNRVKEPIDILR